MLEPAFTVYRVVRSQPQYSQLPKWIKWTTRAMLSKTLSQISRGGRKPTLIYSHENLGSISIFDHF